MNALSLFLSNVSWSEVGDSFQPGVFLVCGLGVLALTALGKTPRGVPTSRIILTLLIGVLLTLGPFASALVDGLFVRGNIRLTVFSRRHGILHPEVSPQSFVVGLIFVGFFLGIVFLATKYQQERKNK